MATPFTNGWAILFPEEIQALSTAGKDNNPLSGSAFSVYLALKHRCWNKKVGWWKCRPSYNQIMDDLNWDNDNPSNKKKVMRAVADLTEAGLISYQRGGQKKGPKREPRANVYSLDLYKRTKNRKGPKKRGTPESPNEKVGTGKGTRESSNGGHESPERDTPESPQALQPNITTKHSSSNDEEKRKPNKREERERKEAERNNPRANDTELWKTWKTLFWGEADGNIPDFTSRTKTSKTRMKGMMMEFGDAEWKKYEEMMEVIWGMDVPIDQNTKNFLEEYGR